jgi:RNA polymerase sigma-70 factor, ECF subfamily
MGERGEPSADVSRLIDGARQAQPGAIDRLLEMYRNYLRLLAGIGIDVSLRGKADPSDLVQETVMKAYQHFDRFRGQTEGELVSWLRQILARNLLDLQRRYRIGAGRQVEREQSLEDMLDTSAHALGQLADRSGPSPSQSAQRRETSVLLADALAQLSDDHRQVLVLRTIRELDWQAVARTMGRSPGAVRQLWTRALKQLRPLIENRL